MHQAEIHCHRNCFARYSVANSVVVAVEAFVVAEVSTAVASAYCCRTEYLRNHSYCCSFVAVDYTLVVDQVLERYCDNCCWMLLYLRVNLHDLLIAQYELHLCWKY